MTVVVPVRYPLSEHSERTLRTAVRVADERTADLTVLHVNLYQTGGRVTRTDLKDAVEERVGHLENVRYLVRRGFLVEESILDEVAAEGAEVVVIGHKQAGRWRRMMDKLSSDPDLETFLGENLDCEIVVAGPGFED